MSQRRGEVKIFSFLTPRIICGVSKGQGGRNEFSTLLTANRLSIDERLDWICRFSICTCFIEYSKIKYVFASLLEDEVCLNQYLTDNVEATV